MLTDQPKMMAFDKIQLLFFINIHYLNLCQKHFKGQH